MPNNNIPLKELVKSVIGCFAIDVIDFLKECSSLNEQERSDLEAYVDRSLSEHQRKVDSMMDGFALELEERLRGISHESLYKI